MTSKQRFLLGLIVAPLSAPLVMLWILSLSPGPVRRLIVSGAAEYVEHFGSFKVVMLTGAVVAYVFAVVFGIPLYSFARKFGLVSFWSCTVGGAAIASVPFVLAGLTEGLKRMGAHGLVYVALAACGFVVGSVFYLIAERPGKERQGH